MRNKSGKFIVIEGIEGAGKSTVVSAVVDLIQQQCGGEQKIVLTREPGGTPFSEHIRQLVKAESAMESALSGEGELLLFYAARLDLINKVIKPALQADAWVVADRYYLSSFAYQCGGRGVDCELAQLLQQKLLGDVKPDLTLWLDLPVKMALERVKKRGKLDRIEQESVAFFERVSAYYQIAADTLANIKKIDASLALPQVIAQINACLMQFIKR